MVERVGLATESAKVMSKRAPRLLIIAGATGVGKSTAAGQIAASKGYTRILSTDAIREIMRTCMDVDDNQALAQQYQVMSIPTIVVEENGQVVDAVIGTTTKEDLIQRLS